MTTPKTAETTEQKVSDLTVSQLRQLIREVVLDCIAESYEDFHRDLEYSEEFLEEMEQRLASEEPAAPAAEVYHRLGLD